MAHDEATQKRWTAVVNASKLLLDELGAKLGDNYASVFTTMDKPAFNTLKRHVHRECNFFVHECHGASIDAAVHALAEVLHVSLVQDADAVVLGLREHLPANAVTLIELKIANHYSAMLKAITRNRPDMIDASASNFGEKLNAHAEKIVEKALEALDGRKPHSFEPIDPWVDPSAYER